MSSVNVYWVFVSIFHNPDDREIQYSNVLYQCGRNETFNDKWFFLNSIKLWFIHLMFAFNSLAFFWQKNINFPSKFKSHSESWTKPVLLIMIICKKSNLSDTSINKSGGNSWRKSHIPVPLRDHSKYIDCWKFIRNRGSKQGVVREENYQ